MASRHQIASKADWHVMDQSRAASDARIAKATDDAIVAAFTRAARDRITATQRRLERVEQRRRELNNVR